MDSSFQCSFFQCKNWLIAKKSTLPFYFMREQLCVLIGIRSRFCANHNRNLMSARAKDRYVICVTADNRRDVKSVAKVSTDNSMLHRWELIKERIRSLRERCARCATRFYPGVRWRKIPPNHCYMQWFQLFYNHPFMPIIRERYIQKMTTAINLHVTLNWKVNRTTQHGL